MATNRGKLASGAAVGPGATGGKAPSSKGVQGTPNHTSSGGGPIAVPLVPVATTATLPTKGTSAAAARSLSALRGR